MCGIAGLIHRGESADIGDEMTRMLLALKHRGPDSTGYALYGDGTDDDYVMRVKLAEQADLQSGFGIHERIRVRREEVINRLQEREVEIVQNEDATEYAMRVHFKTNGDTRHLANYLEDIDGVEILSLGHCLELIKDLGDADDVSKQYGLRKFRGTHAIGHTRMATESDVDIRSAHPYWAYPYADISVVHNGQLTNYWTMRRALERCGHRFMSNCDSELLAVYIANRTDAGDDLESALQRSVEELDGVFTYIVATSNALGMAKDVMAAKPMVLYESDTFIALASEEVAIRSIFPHEINSYDPYEGEVKIWQRN
ncbi:glutamine amidotransferase [Candidatus Persebacteraceae bacterium Df01]|jgi:glutamate synthase domain-containing protein 1|uniref:Glutamine amidotransferase n=1 Tax=Candidatus Doriopsillibacter californiensis TaxID=2970740 RepID=A0ABT7QMX9_9GAMM|nr:glutamine amidotransferase [Candidatus Persebacteraceae bacterium Df01]